MKDQLNIVGLQDGLVDLLLEISDRAKHNKLLYSVHVCVCERERDRERVRERERERKRERVRAERERESECVCVYVHEGMYMYVHTTSIAANSFVNIIHYT